MRALVARARPQLQAIVLLGILALLFALDLYGPSRHGDVDLYHRYAVSFWDTSHPFRALPAEYPPLAVLAFTFTALPPGTEYAGIFGFWMAGLFLAGFWLMDRLFDRRTAGLYLVYLGVGAAGTLLSRYDLMPAVLTVVALAAARRGKFTAAYVLLAVGGLLKLYPLVLVPAIAIEQQRRLGGGLSPRRAVVGGVVRAVAVVGAGFGVAYVLAGPDAAGAIQFARGRPVQVESITASLLWLISALGPMVQFDHSFNSYNLLSTASGPVSAMVSLAMLAGLAWIVWRQARGELNLERAALALVVVLVAGNRVLSPQYMIWILPLVAIAEGFDVLWLLIALLTTAIWPIAYLAEGLRPPHNYYGPGFLLLIAARNLLFLIALWRLLAFSPAERSRSGVTRLAG